MTQESLRLKEYRNMLGMTQSELAESIGIKQDLLSRYEGGKYEIPLDIVKQMYKLHKMSYVWFFHGHGKAKLDEISKATITTDLKEVLLENKILKEKIKVLESRINSVIIEVEEISQSISTKQLHI